MKTRIITLSTLFTLLLLASNLMAEKFITRMYLTTSQGIKLEVLKKKEPELVEIPIPETTKFQQDSLRQEKLKQALKKIDLTFFRKKEKEISEPEISSFSDL